MKNKKKVVDNDGKIELSNPELGEQFFEKSHAERILAYDEKHKVKNWELKDSKLIFEDGKINTRTSDSTNTGAGKQG